MLTSQPSQTLQHAPLSQKESTAVVSDKWATLRVIGHIWGVGHNDILYFISICNNASTPDYLTFFDKMEPPRPESDVK